MDKTTPDKAHTLVKLVVGKDPHLISEVLEPQTLIASSTETVAASNPSTLDKVSNLTSELALVTLLSLLPSVSKSAEIRRKRCLKKWSLRRKLC
jgi:hypothetical protein